MPRQAIVTKYISPTNNHGTQVQARTESGIKVRVAWDHSKDAWENHEQAAFALAFKLGWIPGRMRMEEFRAIYAQGGIPNGYAFVDASEVIARFKEGL